MSKTVILIPSRLSAKRLPGKPLLKINGISIISQVVRKAKEADIGDVYVATEDKEIIDDVNLNGGKAILTSREHKTGSDRIYECFEKLSLIDIDYIINLQGDMPLIQPETIKKVLYPLKNNYSIGTLATSLNSKEFQNPNVTKVEVEWINNNNGRAKNFFRLNNSLSHQIFHHVGIYSFTISSLGKFVNLPKSKNEIIHNLEQFRALDSGITIGISYVPNIPISIDTKEDLISAENIIRQKNEKN